MGLSRIGDWTKVNFLISSLEDELVNAKMLSLRRWGLKAEAVAKTHISRQDLGWKALNPEYLAEKIKAGYSDNILVATSSYFNSITSYAILDSVYVGVRKEERDDNGNFISDVAKLHEYGSKSAGVPERPLWRPTFTEVMLWHVKVNTPDLIFISNLKKYL